MSFFLKDVTVCLFSVFFSTLVLKAQDVQDLVGGVKALGVSMRVTDNTKLFVTGAYDVRFDAKLGIVNAVVKLNKYISISPGYIFLSSPPVSEIKYREHMIFGSAILSVPVIKSFTLEDRNMLQQRFRPNFKDLTVYRNRLRLIYSAEAGKKRIPFWIYGFDEVSYNATMGLWTRNSLSAGAGIKLFDFLSTDLSYAKQTNRGSNSRSFLTVSVIVGLEKWNFFK